MYHLIKEPLKQIGLGSVYLIILILIIKYFKLSVFGIIGFLLIVNLLFSSGLFLSKRLKYEEYIKNLWQGSILICVLVPLVYYLGGYGVLGFILSVIIITTVILYKRRKKFIAAMETIETQIWGKPLKSFKGKPPKVEIKF